MLFIKKCPKKWLTYVLVGITLKVQLPKDGQGALEIGRWLEMRCGRGLKGLILVAVVILLGVTSACAPHTEPTSSLASTLVPIDTVLVSSSSFEPSSALVTVGTSVTWTNQDEVSYFIIDNDESFAFSLPAGGSFSVTFSEAGIYNYHCSVHPYMQGTIIVARGAIT